MPNPSGRNGKNNRIAGQIASPSQAFDDSFDVLKPTMFADPESSVPQYRVLEVCHLNDMLVDPQASAVDPKNRGDMEKYGEFYPCFVFFRGIPGPHLEPVNDAARAMCEKNADRMRPVNPVGELPLVGGNGPDMKVFAKMVAAAMQETQAA